MARLCYLVLRRAIGEARLCLPSFGVRSGQDVNAFTPGVCAGFG